MDPHQYDGRHLTARMLSVSSAESSMQSRQRRNGGNVLDAEYRSSAGECEDTPHDWFLPSNFKRGAKKAVGICAER
jgi:hypothetical protein